VTSRGCFVCDKHARRSEVPGGAIFEDDQTYVGHVLPNDLTHVYLGHLIVEPKRHVEGLGHLTNDEASALGCRVNEMSRLLREVEGANHIYSWVLGDAVPHLHIHLVPRYPDTPREFWGAKVTDWPGAPRGGKAEIAGICERLRRGLPLLEPSD
jgi:diadenosine tetraphosphate (Ap4A) HIT family hydrolase